MYKLGFEIVINTGTVTSKWSPKTAFDFELLNISIL